jgi:hypothetical protein
MNFKVFVPGMLVVLIVMAFVGVSSSWASALCAKDEKACANPLTHLHESTLAGAKAKLKTSILTIECDVLLLSTVLTHTSIFWGLYLRHTTATYTNCNNSCAVTEENGPAFTEALGESHETAKVTGEGLVHVECGAFIDCLYNYEGLVGTAKGPLLSTETNGEVKITEQSLSEEGGSFFCPETSKLTITLTPLSATYITT